MTIVANSIKDMPKIDKPKTAPNADNILNVTLKVAVKVSCRQLTHGLLAFNSLTKFIYNPYNFASNTVRFPRTFVATHIRQ